MRRLSPIFIGGWGALALLLVRLVNGPRLCPAWLAKNTKPNGLDECDGRVGAFL